MTPTPSTVLSSWPTAIDVHVWEAAVRLPDDPMRLPDVLEGLSRGARVDIPFTLSPVVHNADRSESRNSCQISISTLEVMLSTWPPNALHAGLSAIGQLPAGLVCPNIKTLMDSPLHMAPVVGNDPRNTFWADLRSSVRRLSAAVGSSSSSSSGQELTHPIGPWECLTRLSTDLDLLDASSADKLFEQLSVFLPPPSIVDNGAFTRFLRGLSKNEPNVGLALLLLATGEAETWQKASGLVFKPDIQAMIERSVLQQHTASSGRKTSRHLKM